MKRHELKDPRNAVQKFLDQMSGAPEYMLCLTNEQLTKSLDGLNSVEDKGWRIKDLIKKIESSLATPKHFEDKLLFTVTIDISESYLMKNFIPLNKEMVFSKVTSDVFGTTIERF